LALRVSKPLVIGIDSSTTACKAIAWDRCGQAVAEGRATYPLLKPAPNWYEQDAEAWWRGTCAALHKALEQIDAACVDAICITHQRESFVVVDRQGKPIRNAILWLDERSHDQVNQLKRAVGDERFHQITGKPLTTNPAVSKILWLVQHEPEAVARCFKFLDAHAFLIHRLTGAFRSSLASAGPMGLVDLSTHAWSADLMQELGLRGEQFPALLPPGNLIGRVSEAAAVATGLPAGLPVIAGAGDGQCAGLGANATGGGRTALNLGTAVVSGTTSADFLIDRAFRTLYAPYGGKYYLETVILGGVFTVNWFVDRFGTDLRDSGGSKRPEEILEAEAANVPPGTLGLMLTPYWSHAMTPYWDDSATGVTIGWTGAHGREHFYRAILEGIAFEQRLVGDGVMEAIGRRFSEYVALGGGSRSDLWCQIIADVTGVPVVRSTTTEATCLGAGILAATAAGWYPDATRAAEAMTATAERFEPHPATHAFYDQLFTEVYQPLFPTLQTLIDRLTELTRDASAR
jgi:sugar (pentulose or hexulose) kinase